jgi:hypothetical protein
MLIREFLIEVKESFIMVVTVMVTGASMVDGKACGVVRVDFYWDKVVGNP